MHPTSRPSPNATPWRPLPPRRQVAGHRSPVPETTGRLLGIATAIAVLGSTAAVAAPVADRTLGSVVAMRPAESREILAHATPDPTVRVWEDPPRIAADPTLPPPVDRPVASATTTTTTVPPAEAPEATAITLPIQFFDSPRQEVVANRSPSTHEDCRTAARPMPLSTLNEIARMVRATFDCVLTVSGLDEVPPTRTRRWDGAAVWGFESLADQYGAEAVVVGYCESAGFDSWEIRRDNPWGYGGVFQMGGTEMRRFALPASSKYDPVDNTIAAARYLLHMLDIGGGWGGWGPWAVVNTNFDDDVNNQVKVPVLPRFTSTDPDFQGRRGAELPAWAVDPWSWQVPAFDGCPFTGRGWPGARPLDG